MPMDVPRDRACEGCGDIETGKESNCTKCGKRLCPDCHVLHRKSHEDLDARD
jgi:hypothetical protein